MEVTQTKAINSSLAAISSTELSQLLQEGIVAGVIGAAAIAVWFLIMDIVNGQPLHTPTVLGTAFFKGGGVRPEGLGGDLETVLTFTWVHRLICVVIGSMASWLLGIAERNPQIGFGVLLFFVIFECGFAAVCQAFAEPVLHALAWPAVVIGNLIAAAVMAGYFWRHHHKHENRSLM
jgi:hypothetical protein